MGDQLEEDEWPGQDKRKRGGGSKDGQWKVLNKKKRKIELSGSEPEFATDRRVADPSVENAGNCRKRRKIETENCKMQSVEKEEVSECGTAQLSNMFENQGLCQAQENIEICLEIVNVTLEVVLDVDKTKTFNRVCHTQPKQEAMLKQNIGVGNKRKMSPEESINEPHSKKLREIELNQSRIKLSRNEMSEWWKQNVNKQELKAPPNSSNGDPKQNRTKQKLRKTYFSGKTNQRGKFETQKSKITKYFKLNQTERAGLAAGACVEQNNILPITKNDLEGGESAAGERGGVGRHSSWPMEGVGVACERISVPNDPRTQKQVQDKDSGGNQSLENHPPKR